MEDGDIIDASMEQVGGATGLRPTPSARTSSTSRRRPTTWPRSSRRRPKAGAGVGRGALRRAAAARRGAVRGGGRAHRGAPRRTRPRPPRRARRAAARDFTVPLTRAALDDLVGGVAAAAIVVAAGALLPTTSRRRPSRRASSSAARRDRRRRRRSHHLDRSVRQRARLSSTSPSTTASPAATSLAVGRRHMAPMRAAGVATAHDGATVHGGGAHRRRAVALLVALRAADDNVLTVGTHTHITGIGPRAVAAVSSSSTRVTSGSAISPWWPHVLFVVASTRTRTPFISGGASSPSCARGPTAQVAASRAARARRSRAGRSIAPVRRRRAPGRRAARPSRRCTARP